MKKFILAVVVLTATLVVKAQDKIGYINSQEIVALMPAAKSAEAQMKTLGDQKEATLASLDSEYKNKVAAYQRDLPTMTDIVRSSREKEIVDLEAKIKAYYQTAQQELEEKKFSLLKPVLDKVQAAVDKVAADNGYTYIIDMANSVGLVVYKTESRDLNAKVKSALGI